MTRRQARRRTGAQVAARTPQPYSHRRTLHRAAAWRRINRFVRAHPAIVATSLVALHLLLAFLTFLPQPHTGGDNAAYITLGRSLLETGTYTELWDPEQLPHTKYPPVFPAVLALGMLLGLAPWVQLKLVVLTCSAAAVALSFLWIRGRGRPVLGLGVALVLAIAPGVLREARWILSDVPFWAFTMLAIWAFDRTRRDEWAWFALAATATLLAYFTRSAGLPLILAALTWLAWRRRWPQLGALAGIVGVPALLWWLRGRAYGPSGYVSEFWLIEPYNPALGRIGVPDMLERVALNVQKYVSIHLPELLAASRGPLLLGVAAGIFALALLGWAWRLRRARVADLFLPLYLGLIFIWPAVWSGERFLLPALALLLFYAGDAVARLARRFAPAPAFAVTAAAAALLVVLALPGVALSAQMGRECTARYQAGERYPCMGPVWDAFFALSEASREMLPEDAVVLNRKARLYYVLSGFRSSPYPLSNEPAVFFAAADSVGARYVIFDRLDALSAYYLQPVLLRRAGAFCVMSSLPDGTVLFGIRPDHAMVPDRGAAALQAQDASFASCDRPYWRSDAAMDRYGAQR